MSGLRGGMPAVLSAAMLVLSSAAFGAEPEVRGIRGVPSAGWVAESLFVGARILVADSSVDVVVVRRPRRAAAKGRCYFVPQGRPDSLVFLFGNCSGSETPTADTVVLGHFPAGSEMVFAYEAIDTAPRFSEVRGKKIYSGLNREGTDANVAERTGLFGRRWVAVGQVSASRCEAGFEAAGSYGFRDLVLEVYNVTMAKQ